VALMSEETRRFECNNTALGASQLTFLALDPADVAGRASSRASKSSSKVPPPPLTLRLVGAAAAAALAVGRAFGPFPTRLGAPASPDRDILRKGLPAQ
jgi:hypothetical protein